MQRCANLAFAAPGSEHRAVVLVGMAVSTNHPIHWILPGSRRKGIPHVAKVLPPMLALWPFLGRRCPAGGCGLLMRVLLLLLGCVHLQRDALPMVQHSLNDVEPFHEQELADETAPETKPLAFAGLGNAVV